MKYLILVFVFLAQITDCISQNTDIGIFYGRFYALYKFRDYGTGFRNVPKSQYNIFPTIAVNKKYSEKLSAELRLSFMAYEQYTGTRLYTPGFASTYYGGNVSLTANYSLLQSGKFESRIKGGVGGGIFPDRYIGRFVEMFVYPVVDSISRGDIKRNYTSFVPMLSAGIDFSYKATKRFTISVAASYQKGLTRVTEYDIYYNDGNGRNDQRAQQWGTGDFYGMQIGIRYQLKESKKEK